MSRISENSNISAFYSRTATALSEEPQTRVANRQAKSLTFLSVTTDVGSPRPAEDVMEPASQKEQKIISELQQQATELKSEIDHNRLLMRQLAEEKAKAELAVRVKTMLLANISHELRTPLSAIIGLAELAMDDPSCSPTVMESLEVILSSGRAMSELVGELLDVSKLESDALQVDVHKFLIKEVVREVFEMMKVIANKKGLEFEVDIENMPDSILSDPVRFRQIMINMLGNATKFTQKGKVSCLIRLQDRTGRNGEEAMLECFVRDTGIGITSEQAERLFAPFGQGDSSITRRFGGTGLGLFLSRKLAQQLGGDLVLVKSRPNHATTFLCTLSAGAVEVRQGDRVRFSSPTPGPPRTLQTYGRLAAIASSKNTLRKRQRLAPAQGFAKLHPFRVLVVDDVKINRDILVRFIEKAGYPKESVAIATAENGQEAFKLIKDSPDFTLVLMDVHMPVCDGITATRLIRDWYNQPEQATRVCPYIVAASASRDENGLNIMDGVLDKPIKLASLLTILETAVSQKHEKNSTGLSVSIESPPASPSMASLSPLSSPGTPDMSYRALSAGPTGSYIFSQYSDSDTDSPPQFRRTLALPNEFGEVGCMRKAPQSGRALKRVRTDYDMEAIPDTSHLRTVLILQTSQNSRLYRSIARCILLCCKLLSLYRSISRPYPMVLQTFKTASPCIVSFSRHLIPLYRNHRILAMVAVASGVQLVINFLIIETDGLS
eukprot:g30585.t1